MTFDTTTSAFSFKARTQAAGFDGKLVMIPRSLSADCGMAWREPLENEAALIELLSSDSSGCHGPHRV